MKALSLAEVRKVSRGMLRFGWGPDGPDAARTACPLHPGAELVPGLHVRKSPSGLEAECEGECEPGEILGFYSRAFELLHDPALRASFPGRDSSAIVPLMLAAEGARGESLREQEAAAAKLAEASVVAQAQRIEQEEDEGPGLDAFDGFEPAAPRATSSEPKPWPDLLPLTVADVHPFPIEVLPSWLAEQVEAVAEATQTPRDLPAMFGLGVLSTALAGRFEVEVESGWREVVNLFLATALPSGEGKSPAFSLMMAPVSSWETEERRRRAPERAAAGEELRVKEERLKAARARAAKAEGIEAEEAEQKAKELAQDVDLFDRSRVAPFKLMVGADITVEKVADLLGQQGGRLAVASPEGGGLFKILAGRYSDGASSFEVFLSGFSGEPYTVERMGREGCELSRPTLTVSLAVQPSVVRDLADADFTDRGLNARFLYSVPESLLGRRNHRGARPVAGAVRDRHARMVVGLLELPAAVNEHGKPAPNVLRLSAGAREAFLRLREHHEVRLRPEGDLLALAAWVPKARSALLRIAAQFHVADALEAGKAPGPVIEADTMERALRLAPYFESHARAAFDLMGASPDLRRTRAVATWIERRGKLTFSHQELWQNVKGGARFAEVGDLNRALALLERHGYVREVPRAKEALRRPGRPLNPDFEVNPDLLT